MPHFISLSGTGGQIYQVNVDNIVHFAQYSDLTTVCFISGETIIVKDVSKNILRLIQSLSSNRHL